jgi:hypothetical protein
VVAEGLLLILQGIEIDAAVATLLVVSILLVGEQQELVEVETVLACSCLGSWMRPPAKHQRSNLVSSLVKHLVHWLNDRESPRGWH